MSQCIAEVVDKKTGLPRLCKNMAVPGSLYCVMHTEMYGKGRDTVVATATSPRSSNNSSGRGSSKSSGRGSSKGSERKTPLRTSSPGRERKTPRSPETTPDTAGFDALPGDVQALILAQMSVDDFENVTEVNPEARALVTTNVKKCALAGERCSNFWRDEFERTRMTGVRATPEYKAYVATLSDDTRRAIHKGRLHPGHAVRNSLCKLRCEQRAVEALSGFVSATFEEKYPVIFGLTRD
jgi:hypothetical protein